VAVRRAQGSVSFNETVTLTTSLAETKVNKRGVAAGSLDTDAINVGQRILAYGSFSGGALDLSQPGAGFVRLVETPVSGAATGAVSGGQLNVDVVRIGRRKIAAFDFNVNGVAQGNPSSLATNTGALPLSSVTTGTPVIALGFFEPVSATAPAFSFTADTVIDRTDAGSLLRMAWIPASVAPITSSASSTEMTLDAGGAQFAQVDHGLVVPVTLSSDPSVAGATNGFFAVRRRGRVNLFTSFANFKTFLTAEIAAGARMVGFRAGGKYDAGTNLLTARRAVALLF
jgi:hypothetical protein